MRSATLIIAALATTQLALAVRDDARVGRGQARCASTVLDGRRARYVAGGLRPASSNALGKLGVRLVASRAQLGGALERAARAGGERIGGVFARRALDLLYEGFGRRPVVAGGQRDGRDPKYRA